MGLEVVEERKEVDVWAMKKNKEISKLCNDLHKYVYRQCVEKCRELRGRDSGCGCSSALADLVDACLASIGIKVEPWDE